LLWRSEQGEKGEWLISWKPLSSLKSLKKKKGKNLKKEQAEGR